MSRDERYGTRDLTYSRWHRYALPDRCTYIDIDGLEYCRRCRVALAWIETARDVDQPHKTTTVLDVLVRSTNVPGLCLVYRNTGVACTCTSQRRVEGCTHGIESFRVRMITGTRTEFDEWPASEVASWITNVHDAHEWIAHDWRANNAH